MISSVEFSQQPYEMVNLMSILQVKILSLIDADLSKAAHRFMRAGTRMQSRARTFIWSVTSGKSTSASGPQFPHVSKGCRKKWRWL